MSATDPGWVPDTAGTAREPSPWLTETIQAR